MPGNRDSLANGRMILGRSIIPGCFSKKGCPGVQTIVFKH